MSIRSCHDGVDKTVDFHTEGPRFKCGAGSCALGQGTFSWLPSLSEETWSWRSFVKDIPFACKTMLVTSNKEQKILVEWSHTQTTEILGWWCRWVTVIKLTFCHPGRPGDCRNIDNFDACSYSHRCQAEFRAKHCKWRGKETLPWHWCLLIQNHSGTSGWHDPSEPGYRVSQQRYRTSQPGCISYQPRCTTLESRCHACKWRCLLFNHWYLTSEWWYITHQQWYITSEQWYCTPEWWRTTSQPRHIKSKSELMLD